MEAYANFTGSVISDETDRQKKDLFFKKLAKAAETLAAKGTPLSVVADFNGSARAASIDRSFLASCGIALSSINDAPGAIAHRIVPEGASLDYCAREMLRLRTEGKTPQERNAVIGYVPDCDGDRGNIVYWDDRITSYNVCYTKLLRDTVRAAGNGKILITLDKNKNLAGFPSTLGNAVIMVHDEGLATVYGNLATTDRMAIEGDIESQTILAPSGSGAWGKESEVRFEVLA